MSEGTQDRPENPGAERDVASEGDEGRRAAEVTPPLDPNVQTGQTESPAPPGDVGVPPDERIAGEEHAARSDEG
jgi:hypothetical protein